MRTRGELADTNPSPGSMADERFTTEIRSSPLVEARVASLRTARDVDDFSSTLGALVTRVPSAERPVLVADHRPVVVYPQAAAERLAELFVRMNSRLARVAILVAPSNATLAMQLDRLVREANNPVRRVFYLPDEALEHMRPALGAAQLARARAFLSELAPKP